MSELGNQNSEEVIKHLESRSDSELLFMASIIRLLLDDRGVWYPSRESGNQRVD